MRALARFFDRLAADESGATMVEYTILVGLISVVAVGIIILIYPNIRAIWTKVNTSMANAASVT
jgi:pilus assembly protein Flp/PilA